MKRFNVPFGILIVGILAFLLFTMTPATQSSCEQVSIILNVTEQVNTTPVILDPMPVSDYIRKYNMTTVGRVYRPINGTSYIDPNHEVVQWYVRNTVLNETGLFYLSGKRVSYEFQPDFDCENEDHWMNADWYLSHKLVGDCEDFAVAMCSILEGKGVPNMLICVSDRRRNSHAYAEYYYEEEYYIADIKSPYYRLRSMDVHKDLPELWMFHISTDYTSYNTNWATS